MRVADFDFELPDGLIAERPVEPREAARLLCVAAKGDFSDHRIADIPSLLQPGDLLVFNDTRVIPARLFGMRRREGSVAQVEVLLHRRREDGIWRALARPMKRIRDGDVIEFGEGFAGRVIGREGDEMLLALETTRAEMAEIERVGTMPLPPYILSRRPADDRDHRDYQTMFAARAGAVAAPTAGLHFTPGLMAALADRGVRSATITLHVGAGTFLPVKVEDVRDHRMHAEHGEIGETAAEAIAATRAAGGRVVAVGTTSLRLLEAVARANDGRVVAWSGETDIFIAPGYRFAVADALITNFHLPRSTLVMLVAAFIGMDLWRAMYAHAVKQGYRFYSYGDASFLERAMP